LSGLIKLALDLLDQETERANVVIRCVTIQLNIP
jgi:hypothetical protein